MIPATWLYLNAISLIACIQPAANPTETPPDPLNGTFPKVYQKSEMADKLEALRTYFGGKVTSVDPELELALLLTMRHFPELKDRRIKIVYTSIGAPLMARPSLLNFLRPARQNTYYVLIKRDSFVRDRTLNEQVALIGHEVAHFLTYRKQTTLGLIGTGLCHVFSKKFRLKFERETDRRTVRHGLGPQLLDFHWYISAAEIRQLMATMESENNTQLDPP